MKTDIFHKKIIKWVQSYLDKNTKGKGKIISSNIPPRRWKCIDCKCLPWVRGEDFYVNDKLWKQVVPENGIICLRCFEKRLGRRLTKKDFKPWFRKNRWAGDKRRIINKPPSERLASRLKLRH